MTYPASGVVASAETTGVTVYNDVVAKTVAGQGSVSIGSGLSPAPGQSLFQVAGQTRIPVIGGGVAQLMGRTRHRIYDTVTSVRVAYPNYFINSSDQETGAGGTSTITAGLVTPGGSIVQVTWGGSPSVLVADGLISQLSDPIPVSAVAGDAIFFQTYFTTLGGSILTASANGQDTANNERVRVAASGLADQTMTAFGTWTGGATSTNYTYGPCLIVTTTTKPCVLLLGDSVVEQFNDTYTGTTSDIGIMARMVGQYYAYTKQSRQGASAFQFLLSTSNAVALSAYFTHVVCEYGVNDTTNTLGPVISDRMVAIRALFPSKKFYPVTVSNVTASSNAYIDAVGQTPDAARSPRINSYNDLVRAGIPGVTGFIELNDFLSTGRNTNIWNFDGTPSKWTSDGTHPSQFTALAGAAANIIGPGTFT